MNVRHGIVVAVSAVLVFGCTHMGQLKAKAARDLGCDDDEVEVLNGGYTRDVECRGKHATYHWGNGHWARQDKPADAPAAATGDAQQKASPPPPAPSPPPRKEEWQ